ncbi:MAG: hypothetical protein R3A48_26480 [Polyangiales bacterium]
MEPPFVFSRESTIRIDVDGRVWHDGERIENPRLAESLAGWIAWDDASGRWILKNAMSWCYVTLDGTPLVVRSARVLEGEAAVQVDRSDGARERVPLERLRVDPEGAVYAYVRGGELLARFDRAAAFAVLDRADLDAEGLFLDVNDVRVPLMGIDSGAVPPYRLDPSQDPVPPSR